MWYLRLLAILLGFFFWCYSVKDFFGKSLFLDELNLFQRNNLSLDFRFSEEKQAELGKLIHKYVAKAQQTAIRDLTLNEGLRLDGRKTTEIRPIWCEVDYLPTTHGSYIFTRGEVQATATVNSGTTTE